MKKCGLKEQARAEILLSAGSGVDGLSEFAASHLLECESCAEAFAGQSALWNRLDVWTVPEVSSGFNRELYARIDAAAAEPWYDRVASQIKSLFTQPVLALATAALVIVGGFTIDHAGVNLHRSGSAEMSTIHAPSVQVSTSEADQVEKTLDDIEMLRQFDLTVEEKETTSKSM